MSKESKEMLAHLRQAQEHVKAVLDWSNVYGKNGNANVWAFVHSAIEDLREAVRQLEKCGGKKREEETK